MDQDDHLKKENQSNHHSSQQEAEDLLIGLMDALIEDQKKDFFHSFFNPHSLNQSEVKSS